MFRNTLGRFQFLKTNYNLRTIDVNYIRNESNYGTVIKNKL